ncbi:MAG: RsiV family protein [Lawsonibacter sp.]|jgi:hypothetical protein
MERKGKPLDGEVSLPIRWHEAHRTLTLEGEPVLTFSILWPELLGAGFGGKRISRYYSRMARQWSSRWEKEVYWWACLDLAEQRRQSRPFSPWSGFLKGEVAYYENGLLSLRFTGEEVRKQQKVSRVQWGDVWKIKEGAPLPLKDLFAANRNWRKTIVQEILRLGREEQQKGTRFFQNNWEDLAKKPPLQDYCLTQEGIELSYPQCTIAPAVEQNPVFLLPWQPPSA